MEDDAATAPTAPRARHTVRNARDGRRLAQRLRQTPRRHVAHIHGRARDQGARALCPDPGTAARSRPSSRARRGRADHQTASSAARPLIAYRPVWKSKFRGAFVLNHRASSTPSTTPARWRGDQFLAARPSQDSRVIAGELSEELHPAHWLISTQRRRRPPQRWTAASVQGASGAAPEEPLHRGPERCAEDAIVVEGLAQASHVRAPRLLQLSTALARRRRRPPR